MRCDILEPARRDTWPGFVGTFKLSNITVFAGQVGEQRLRAADYVPDGGPPIWVVLDRVYRAVRDAVAGKRETAAVEKAFASFRLQVARVPELAAEVQRALPGADGGQRASTADIDAMLRAVGRGAAVLGAAHPVGALGGPAIAGAAHLAHDARVAVRYRRQGPVPEQAYRLILGRVEELAGCFARGLRLVSTTIGPVVVLLYTSVAPSSAASSTKV